MIKLLIIADDFTGALDTGVQFAARGADTCVMVDTSFDFSGLQTDASVLVVNAESRHLAPQDAYATVYKLVTAARERGISNIYKKTDSALRGNVGAELAAAMDAAGAKALPFVPAFPQMGRVTREGVLYINNDVPVAESVFGADPFEPVRYSAVADILAAQTDKKVFLCSPEPGALKEGICLFDAASEADLYRIADFLTEDGLSISAGCAGFAPVLAERLNLGRENVEKPEAVESLLVVCGSLNPVTVGQIDYAEKCGYPRIRLTPEQKLDLNWLDSEAGHTELERWMELTKKDRLCIVDVNGQESDATNRYGDEHGLRGEEVRIRIGANLGKLIRHLLDNGLDSALMCVGGDTLLAVMRSINVKEITLVGEIALGVVLTEFCYKGKKHQIISKSGGFGEPELLSKLIQKETLAC